MNQYGLRKYVIGGIIVIIFSIFLGKLFFLQVLNESYELSSENNIIRRETEYPARGLIYDRDGDLLVANQATYDLMVDPQVIHAFDTNKLSNILNVSKTYLHQKISEAKHYSNYKPSIVIKQISPECYAVLQEQLFQFPGFFVQPRTIRRYIESIAPHIIGYVGEVSEQRINNSKYYEMGDYIGKTGIERTYEEILRGKKGKEWYLVDVHNRIKGEYKDGRYNSPAKVGKNIHITIDDSLQQYAESLIQNKIGSIVALNPKTGGILTLVSSPTYNPRLLIGRQRTDNYKKLNRDTLKPLFNRALMANYPPGSTFKVINALTAREEHVISLGRQISCYGGYHTRSISVKCHSHKSPVNFIEGIQYSCNTYFCTIFRRLIDNNAYPNVREAFHQWRNHVTSFGLGSKLQTDFPSESNGFIPTKEYYSNYYGKHGWRALTIISLAIGQGEIGVTPLQLANMTAAIANRGWYYIPHVIKSIEDEQTIPERFTKKQNTTIDSVHFEPVIRGMELAVNGKGGTGWRARLPDITVCGKTGTSQNPHGEDHSIFIAFAPKDNPQIAVAAVIENGGYGNQWGAPIAGLIIEKYLKGSVSKKYMEEYVLNGNLINPSEKTD